MAGDTISIFRDYLKGNCSEKFLLQNIFKLSTETVIMPKNNFEQFWTGKAGNQLRRTTAGSSTSL